MCVPERQPGKLCTWASASHDLRPHVLGWVDSDQFALCFKCIDHVSQKLAIRTATVTFKESEFKALHTPPSCIRRKDSFQHRSRRYRRVGLVRPLECSCFLRIHQFLRGSFIVQQRDLAPQHSCLLRNRASLLPLPREPSLHRNRSSWRMSWLGLLRFFLCRGRSKRQQWVQRL